MIIVWLRKYVLPPVMVAVILGALTLAWTKAQLPAQNRQSVERLSQKVDSLTTERDSLSKRVKRIESQQIRHGEKLSNVDGKLDVIIELLNRR